MAPQRVPDVVVVGCDSVLELDGAVHGKPRDAAEADARWRGMRGRTRRPALRPLGRRPSDGRSPAAQPGRWRRRRSTSPTVTDAEIDAYVATGEPLQVAGAFTIDGLGGAFVDGIEGDHHNVVGLSLPLLRRLLADLGRPLDRWSWEIGARPPIPQGRRPATIRVTEVVGEVR